MKIPRSTMLTQSEQDSLRQDLKESSQELKKLWKNHKETLLMKKKKEDEEKEEEKKEIKGVRFQKEDSDIYEPKVIIEADLDSVLKVFVSNPNPLLVKREGNKKKKKKHKE